VVEIDLQLGAVELVALAVADEGVADDLSGVGGALP
jgi:hypothetical protein